MIFSHLRTIPWNPVFGWVDTSAKAADRINVWHEDYPARVEATQLGIEKLLSQSIVHRLFRFSILVPIHHDIFPELAFEQFRQVDVTVGLHHPVRFAMVKPMTQDLESHYVKRCEDEGLSLDLLKEWYIDFETLHPFRDGNGRVGGIVIAAGSYAITGAFLVPGQ